VVRAVQELELTMPLVVRLSGTNVEEGMQIIKESGLKITTAHTLAEAAEKVVGEWKSLNMQEAS
jgi:malate-CoA ligase subunit beta